MSAVRNVRWVGMIQVTRICVQLLGLLVLSRLLTPADFGLGLAVCLFGFSFFAEHVFRAAGLAPLVQLSALSFPFLSATAVHQALLERASKFSTVARIEIVALLTGFTVAVVSAYLGAGP